MIAHNYNSNNNNSNSNNSNSNSDVDTRVNRKEFRVRDESQGPRCPRISTSSSLSSGSIIESVRFSQESIPKFSPIRIGNFFGKFARFAATRRSRRGEKAFLRRSLINAFSFFLFSHAGLAVADEARRLPRKSGTKRSRLLSAHATTLRRRTLLAFAFLSFTHLALPSPRPRSRPVNSPQPFPPYSHPFPRSVRPRSPG